MQNIEFKQRQHWNNHLIMSPEIFNQVHKIAERTKQPMQQYEGLPITFFNESELIRLFDLVLHLRIKIFPINIR